MIFDYIAINMYNQICCISLESSVLNPNNKISLAFSIFRYAFNGKIELHFFRNNQQIHRGNVSKIPSFFHI